MRQIVHDHAEMAVARCQELLVGRDGVPCTRALTLEIRAGERLAVIGPSGTGKTTFLRTLAGQLAPIGGGCEIVGTRLGKLAPHQLVQRGLAYVGDDRGVFLTLSVREYVDLALSGPHKNEDAHMMIASIPTLATRPNARIATLSGGERQSLGVGCALARKPRLLIVDELTQGLQNAISGTLVARILAACMHDDLSIIFTDDNPEIVDALAGRRLNIEDGTCE